MDVVEAYESGAFVRAHAASHPIMKPFAIGMQGMGGQSLQRHLGLPGGPRPPRCDHSTPESMEHSCGVLRTLDIAVLREFEAPG